MTGTNRLALLEKLRFTLPVGSAAFPLPYTPTARAMAVLCTAGDVEADASADNPDAPPDKPAHLPRGALGDVDPRDDRVSLVPSRD